MKQHAHSSYLQIGNPHCCDNAKHHKEHASDDRGGYAGKHRPDFPEDAAEEHGAGAGNDHHAAPDLGQEEEEAVVGWHSEAEGGSASQCGAAGQGLRL